MTPFHLSAPHKFEVRKWLARAAFVGRMARAQISKQIQPSPTEALETWPVIGQRSQAVHLQKRQHTCVRFRYPWCDVKLAHVPSLLGTVAHQEFCIPRQHMFRW